MAPQNKKPLLLLLDAHAIIHRAYHALPDFATRAGVPSGAIFGFTTMLLKIIEDFNPTYIVACYDLPGKTFRHESYDSYKGTRSKTDEVLTMQFDTTRKVCEFFGIPIYDAAGFEADDVLGTITHHLKDSEVDIIIASGDMDTLQLVDQRRVQVYTLKRGMNDTVLYDEEAVIERFQFEPESIIDYKALRGDSSDNIPGIKGIGEKAATLAISRYGTIESLYQALEKDEQELLDTGLTKRMVSLIREGKEEAEFSKVLATIRRDAPISFKLPSSSWRELVDLDSLFALFEEYEFRALPQRLRSLLGVEEKQEEEFNQEEVSEEELHDTSLALWVLDSEEKEATLEDILRYAKTKSFSSARKKILEDLSQDPDSEKIFTSIERPLAPIISTMQENGIRIDIDFFTSLSQEYHTKLDALEKEIHHEAKSSFNVRSPKQLSEVLFEQLELPTKGIKKSSKTGVYSTNAQMLEKLVDTHPIINKILEYRELDKLVGTYIDVLPNLVGSDGRLHPTFIQNGTTTGRFSSKDPNVQNIPTRSELGRKIREGFVAEENWELVSLDYSQIELRCLAMLSRDTQLIQIFNEGRDIHSAVASLIGGVPEAEVDREMRRKAKIVNFGILYGMGVNSLRKQMGGSRAEAQTFYDGFFNQFPEATAYLEATKEHARKHGYTKTLFGRRRHFPNVNSKVPFIRAMAERMALNAPIQGTSADMIKVAMIAVDEYLKEEKLTDMIRFVLQIHDEIIFEVKKEVLDTFVPQATRLMQEALQNSYLSYEPPLPLVVHHSSGITWGDLK